MSNSYESATTIIIKNLLDTYENATHEVVRSEKIAEGCYFYPEHVVQMDLVYFQALFVKLWERELQASFSQLFQKKREAFDVLFASIGEFGAFYTDICPTNKPSKFEKADILQNQTRAYQFCQTLRNADAHFNFNYVNLSTVDYFQRLRPAVQIPVNFPTEDKDNYRIYLLDWNPFGSKKPFAKSTTRRLSFGDADSESRAIKVRFQQLLYSLHLFLRYFVEDPKVEVRNIYKNPHRAAVP